MYPKGVIRELNFMPVKSHGRPTHYGYKSHVKFGTQKNGTQRVGQKVSHWTLTPVRYMSKAIKMKVTFMVTIT